MKTKSQNQKTWSNDEYWIYCDESIQEGSHYSHFFGGVILPSLLHSQIENSLRIKKAELGFLGEMKWQRVTELWLDGYKKMITAFFDLLRNDQLHMRMIFCENSQTLKGLSRSQRDEGYFKLYYQFIKHGFGLAHMPLQQNGIRLRLFFDQFPHTKEKIMQFKGYVNALPASTLLKHLNVKLSYDHITEVDSKEHTILQCVDIILGSMAFRFNEMHKIKQEGKNRGKRTIAKDKLYRHILAEIRTLKSHFHPKISTAIEPYPGGMWTMPYRHWSFSPNADHEIQ